MYDKIFITQAFKFVRNGIKEKMLYIQTHKVSACKETWLFRAS